MRCKNKEMVKVVLQKHCATTQQYSWGNRDVFRYGAFVLQKGIKTNATQSIPSPVKNLCEVHNHVKLEKLLGAIGWEYLRTCPLTLQDLGKEHIGKQRGFQLVNPTDQWFPGKLSFKNKINS